MSVYKVSDHFPVMIVATKAQDEVLAAWRRDAAVRMIDIVGIGGELFGTDAEGADGRCASAGIDQLLLEAGRSFRRSGVEAVGAGKGAEIGIEGAVFLIDHENIFDVSSKKPPKLRWQEPRFLCGRHDKGRDVPAGHGGAVVGCQSER